LAEAIVSLAEVPRTTRSDNAKPGTWTIDQKDYRFIPETLAVRAGDQIKFTNSDPVLHDVTTQQREDLASEGVKRDSFSLKQRQQVSQTYRDAGGTERPVTLSCRFHSAMRGWIYVFDHPFHQVTKQEGTFHLEDVPAGKHRLVMVHPAGDLRWDQVVEVSAGETRRIEIRVSPDDVLATEK
jgi:plastocyanin